MLKRLSIFAYGLAVAPVHRFSALAGGLALGFMMIPIITRTTEELLNLVPSTLREGSLALGATRARAAFGVMVPAALPGIMTGVLVALARIAGETAPLLFTSFNNRFFSTRLDHEIAFIVEGDVEVTDADGTVCRAEPGDILITPNGTKAVWKALTPVKKFWAI